LSVDFLVLGMGEAWFWF